ncbi:hypothetical protein Pan216_13980 [Planctomycetes bacterium Pan216]|uniref:SGNH hydrolase-type esterase domain-containing protein n=1 Tax=Kolteria novifilia TaxID=2527975 RepID=A0A518B0R9_9BACT|nr:hypothetical protein Pan216_13980 [Planctomycetes bacterium Pan216]
MPITWKRRVVFAFVPLLGMLALGELLARGWLYTVAGPEHYPKFAVPSEFPQAAKYRPHHYLCYVPQPNYHRGMMSHNSLGYRGKEINQPKPPGTLRIVTLGGSTTYGEFIDRDEATYPARVEHYLRERTGRGDIEVINAGCPGYNSWESLGNLQHRVLDLEPDLVIVYHGVNDVHCRLVRPDAYAADNSGRRQHWTPPIETRLCRYSCLARVVGHFVGLWRLPGVDSYVRAPTCDPGLSGPSERIGGDPMRALDRNPPIHFDRNLRSMIGVARAHGIEIVLATWASCPAKGDYIATPHYRRGVVEANEVIRLVAGERNAPLLELASAMPVDPAFWRDGRHVNAAGADRQGQLVADFLVERGLVPMPGPSSATVGERRPDGGRSKAIRRSEPPHP